MVGPQIAKIPPAILICRFAFCEKTPLAADCMLSDRLPFRAQSFL
jgi:hypothetical protein